MTKIAPVGLDLVRRMVDVQEQVERAERDLHRARTAVDKAQEDLIKWLVPKGAKVGEVFCLPVADTFLEVRVVSRRTPLEYHGDGDLPPDYMVLWRNGRPDRERI